MFPRTVSRKNRDGTEISYYQIVKSVWDPAVKYPRPKVIASLGRITDENRAEIVALAEKMIRQLDPEMAARLDAVGKDSLAPEHPTRPFGAIYTLGELWHELGLDVLLRRTFQSAKAPCELERAVFAMVAYYATYPGAKSKRACWREWLAEKAFVPGAHGLKLGRFYEAMDRLEEAQERVQRSVFEQVASKLNVAVDLVFYYDTTTVFWEIEEDDEEREWKRPPKDPEALRMRGNSKDHRPDAPQVVLAMAVTKDGFPVRSWVLPGNTTDITTIEGIKKDLNAWKLHRCIVVGDRGFASVDNMEMLTGGGGGYILGVPMRRGEQEVRDVLARAGRYKCVKDNLKVKEVTYPHEGGARSRKYAVCFNPEEAQRDRLKREQLIERLEAELEALHRRKPKDRRQRIHELMAHKSFKRYLKELKSGHLRINRGKVREEARLDGKYLITGSDPTLTAEDLALGYKYLKMIERAWRALKSEVEVGPANHYAPRRIRAHVRICQLALTLMRLVEVRAGMTWAEASLVLDKVHAARVDPDVLGTTPAPYGTRRILSKAGVPSVPRLLPVLGDHEVAREPKS